LTAGGKALLVYADGSCLGNPGPGGWGVVIVEPDGATRELCGYDPATTNNRMELTAAIEGLRFTPASAGVILRSDSEYLVKTITLGWKRNKNLDLWRALDAELAGRKVSLEWVRGHAGDPLNDRADQLAIGAARAGIAIGADVAANSIDAPWLASPIPPQAAPPSSPGSPLVLSAAEREIADRLTPALRQGESIRRCAGCGRVFVGAAPNQTGARLNARDFPRAQARPAKADESAAAYCALAECQLKARLEENTSSAR